MYPANHKGVRREDERGTVLLDNLRQGRAELVRGDFHPIQVGQHQGIGGVQTNLPASFDIIGGFHEALFCTHHGSLQSLCQSGELSPIQKGS